MWWTPPKSTTSFFDAAPNKRGAIILRPHPSMKFYIKDVTKSANFLNPPTPLPSNISLYDPVERTSGGGVAVPGADHAHRQRYCRQRRLQSHKGDWRVNRTWLI